LQNLKKYFNARKLGTEEAKLVVLRSQAEDLTHQALTLDRELQQNVRYLNYFNNNLRQLHTAKSRLENALNDSDANLQELRNERDRLHNLITLAQAEVRLS
jgi:chaperonin cofactor prefoldin